MEATQMFIGAGIPMEKLDFVRRFLEKHTRLSLASASYLKREYVAPLLKLEVETQMKQVFGKTMSVIADGSPRQGDVFVLIVRFVEKGEDGVPRVVQLLISVQLLKFSMNSNHLCSAIVTALRERRLVTADVTAISLDGCSTNVSAVSSKMAAYQTSQEEKPWLLSLCFSHCANNAGEKCTFVVLDTFWSLLQMVFKNSELAQNIWVRATEQTFPDYSQTRWFCKYENLVIFLCHLPLLPGIIEEIVDAGIASTSGPKLLKMLLDVGVMHFVGIQLAATVHGLKHLVEFCYTVEGDGQLVFSTGRHLDRILAICTGPTGMPEMFDVDARIRDAVAYSQGLDMARDYLHSVVISERPTLQELSSAVGARPVRRAATYSKTQEAKTLKEKQLSAQAALEHQQAVRTWEINLEAAKEAEVALQVNNLPNTVAAWDAMVRRGVRASYQYFLERCIEGGDRHTLTQLFQGAGVMNPWFAKHMSRSEAFTLFDKLLVYPQLNDDMIKSLKFGFFVYKKLARLDENLTETPENVVLWHLTTWKNPTYIRKTDQPCRLCDCPPSESCRCIFRLKRYYKVAKLLVLIQPSSAGAERVFSLMNNLIGDQQSTILGDIMQLTLFYRYNKRLQDA
jgi:hypothetical protein